MQGQNELVESTKKFGNCSEKWLSLPILDSHLILSLGLHKLQILDELIIIFVSGYAKKTEMSFKADKQGNHRH